MNEYEPIDCSIHDRLEAFAVKGVPCRVEYVTPGGEERTSTGRIVDVFARAGAEYLHLEDGTEVRLDRLRSVERQDD
jgi:Rho-binding antiterminator